MTSYTDVVTPKHAYLESLYKKIATDTKEINNFFATIVHGSGAICFEGHVAYVYFSPAWIDYQDPAVDFDETKCHISYDLDTDEYISQPDIPFPLTLDLDTDYQSYLEIVTPLLEAFVNIKTD